MGELATNQAPQSAPAVPPEFLSQYARMIPGVSAIPASRSVPRRTSIPNRTLRTSEMTAASVRPKTIAQLFLPHPIADAWTLYQWVAFDLLVLGSVGALQARLLSSWSFHEASLPLFAVLVTLFAFSEGAYVSAPDPFPAGTVPALTRSVLFATLLVFLAYRGTTHVRAIPATIVISLSSLLLYRRLRQFAWPRQRHDLESRRVLLVGAGPIARSIARVLRNDPLRRIVVRGFVDDELPLSPDVLGRVADLDWLARGEFIDEIILALPGQPVKTRQAAELAFRNHLDIRAVPDLPPGPWPEASVDYVGEVPIVTLHREPVPTAGLFLKRLIDLSGAAAGLLFTAPVMTLIAFLIRLESPGPVIYAAERTGAKGRRFCCYKFRSMVANADHLKDDLRTQNQREGPIFKIVDDPRITRVGRLIRRYSLDELPQLWNVLRGDMSLVGPRPHPVDEVHRYELHHYRRLDVKPGLTGLWQITARHSPSFELNMHLDLTYIENWSLNLDLHILLSTIRVLFSPEGA